MSSFLFAEYSLNDFKAGFRSKRFSSRDLVEAYLSRIEEIDHLLGSVIELNPDALAIADRCDRQRSENGFNDRGLLHGIPVLIKDNIDTADKMKTTAGSLALAETPTPSKDAFVVEQLRDAGAIILGKTNMSEWAYARASNGATSGWSARGGFTHNPYALDHNPLGSSSGSAVAVSANLCAVAVGTETDGSILSPSSACGVVGIKPSVGLVSRNGIIPISFTQDTAGPIARSVSDAAALLTVLASDNSTSHAVDYTQYLDDHGLADKRIGVLDFFVSCQETKIQNLFNETVRNSMEGEQVIHIQDAFDMERLWAAERIVFQYEYKYGLNKYLENLGSESKMKSIEDIIGFNETNAETELKYFGQDYLVETSKRGSLEDQEYLRALADCKKLSQKEGIDRVIEQYDVDCLIAPTCSLPQVTDPINGDSGYVASTSLAAVAGYPSITVPLGFINNLPTGISFIGKNHSEPQLIAIAYAFEQLTKARKNPKMLAN